MDPYAILGVSRQASAKEIKQAYRKLSLQYHPDRNPSEDAKAKVQDINHAYEILGDEQARAQYDLTGDVSGQPHPQRGAHFFHFGGGGPPGGGPPGGDDIPEIFKQMFGMGGPFQQHPFGHPFHNIFRQPFGGQRAPQPIIKQVDMTLDQVLTGIPSCQIQIERTVSVFEEDRMGDPRQIYDQTTETVTLTVAIQPGIQPDERQVVVGQGHVWRQACGPQACGPQACGPQHGDIRGDVQIQPRILPHAHYRRIGNDLFYEKHISLKEALCGFSFQLPPIGNRETMNVHCNDTIITPNMTRQCPGLGFVRVDGQAPGNMTIQFIVDFPETLSPDCRAQLAVLL